MRTILSGLFIIIAFIASAQRACVSAEYLEQQRIQDPSISARIAAVEKFIKVQSQSHQSNRENAGTLIKIPVVVHVVYKTDAQNISDAQIKTQIDALNRDFRRLNADTVNTPARFKALSADVQIEFALATADPAGRATTGIVRKKTNVGFWTYDDKIKYSKQGGDDAWDAKSYLNMWVGNLSGLQAYTSVLGCKAELDGVVVCSNVFGTMNVLGQFNMGRTVVHEVGHWLGLKHIWGDTYCGDDLIDDTPKQGNFTSGCPNGFLSSCDNGALGDMYMNYMDYTNDACLNLFTQGQKNRMRSMFNEGGPRNSLLSSKGLNQPWTTEAPVVVETPAGENNQVNGSLRFYPNPAINEISVDFDFNQTWIGKRFTIVNMNGTAMMAAAINAKGQKINISALKPGMYFLEGENGNQKVRERFVKM